MEGFWWSKSPPTLLKFPGLVNFTKSCQCSKVKKIDHNYSECAPTQQHRHRQHSRRRCMFSGNISYCWLTVGQSSSKAASDTHCTTQNSRVSFEELRQVLGICPARMQLCIFKRKRVYKQSAKVKIWLVYIQHPEIRIPVKMKPCNIDSKLAL